MHPGQMRLICILMPKFVGCRIALPNRPPTLGTTGSAAHRTHALCKAEGMVPLTGLEPVTPALRRLLTDFEVALISRAFRLNFAPRTANTQRIPKLE